MLRYALTQIRELKIINEFITWEAIADEVITILHSESDIIIKDLGWPDKPALFDVSEIKKDFGFSFNSRERVIDHINYYLSVYN